MTRNDPTDRNRTGTPRPVVRAAWEALEGRTLLAADPFAGIFPDGITGLTKGTQGPSLVQVPAVEENAQPGTGSTASPAAGADGPTAPAAEGDPAIPDDPTDDIPFPPAEGDNLDKGTQEDSLVPAPPIVPNPDPGPAPAPGAGGDDDDDDDDDNDGDGDDEDEDNDGDGDGDGDDGGAVPTIPDPPDPSAVAFDENDQIGEAREIEYGESLNAQIGDDLDVDMYRIAVEIGDIVAFDIDNRIGNSTLDTYLRLFGPNGVPVVLVGTDEPIESDNDNAPGEGPPDDGTGGGGGDDETLEPFLLVEFLQGGVFYLGVSGSGEEPNSAYDALTGTGDTPADFGNYTLHVVRLGENNDRNDQIGEAEQVGDDSETDGDINLPYDVDMYRVEVEDGDFLEFDVDIDDDDSDDGFNPMLQVFDASGNLLGSSDDAPGPGEGASFEPYLRLVVDLGLDADNESYIYIAISTSGNDDYDPILGGDDEVPTLFAEGDYTLRINEL